MRWVLAAFMALSSMTVAACSGGDGTTDMAASTPSPTIDVPGSHDGNVPPPVTRSPTPSPEPTADAVAEWEPIWDPSERVGVSLPARVEQFESTTALADGSEAAVTGYNLGNSDNLIGFEVVAATTPQEGAAWYFEAIAAQGGAAVQASSVAVYVAGPATERERLEAEFARLTTGTVFA
jgi:hypothetical protein